MPESSFKAGQGILVPYCTRYDAVYGRINTFSDRETLFVMYQHAQ